VVLEDPKRAGWKPVSPPGGVEETASAYRFALDLKPGETRSEILVFEMPRLETLRITELDDARLAAVTASDAIEPKAKQAFAELAKLRRSAADKKGAVQRVKTQLDALTADQARLRDNLGAVDKGSALHKRYMDKLAEEENQLETQQAARAKAEDESHAADAALAGYIAQMSF
jgi:septal ring factor EnvC (AmiA/AmiB activator)